ncbi:MAG: DUF3667 domain-containing protein [Myxococcota bacterium]
MFCHACGQGHQHPKLKLRVLVEDLVESLIELDSRVFRTVWGMTVRPGDVVRDYLDGRRIVYINPFKYALVAVTLAFVVLPWVGTALGLEDGTKTADGFEWQKLLNLMALPLTATTMFIVFIRRGRSWVEHLVIVLFALGHTFVLQTILGSLFMLVAPQWSAVMTIIPIAWLAWSARKSLDVHWAWALAGAVLSFGGVLLLVPWLKSLIAPATG